MVCVIDFVGVVCCNLVVDVCDGVGVGGVVGVGGIVE